MKQKLEPYINQNLIFVHFKFKKPVETEIWIEGFQSFFDALTGFFITDKSGIFALGTFNDNLLSKIDEAVELIETDFSTKVQFSIGLPQTIDADIESKLQEEHTLFLNSIRDESIISLPHTHIHQNFNHFMDEMMFKGLKNYIHQNTEIKEAIQKLFETNNNIAQSASELYLHRNTLIYRMNKFKKDTQLDLNDPYNLLICYLLTLEETP